MKDYRRHSRKERKKRFIRQTDPINELYYARDNNPNFYQFKHYHFTDSEGRMYKIATDDEKTFENDRFYTGSQRPSYLTTHRRIKQKKCVVSPDGYIKIYVKLPNQRVQWFSTTRAINRYIELKERHNEHDVISVKLRQAFKFVEKRRTGTIYVSNVDKGYLNGLLNVVV